MSDLLTLLTDPDCTKLTRPDECQSTLCGSNRFERLTRILVRSTLALGFLSNKSVYLDNITHHHQMNT